MNKATNQKTVESWRDWYKGESELLLRELHLVSRGGQLNQDSRRKLKQVQHLIQLISPFLNEGDTVVDVGAGKSYLGLLLYDSVLRHFSSAELVGVESRLELCKSAQAIAVNSGFKRARFVNATAEEFIRESRVRAEVQTEDGIEGNVEGGVEGRVGNEAGVGAGVRAEKWAGVRASVVVALHACDTATDDAIALGLNAGARVMALVPCCQAELAQRLKEHQKQKARFSTEPGLESLYRHPWHRREFGSHLTNVIRCLALEAFGYKVTVTELVGFEHSLKNEIIIAEKKPGTDRAIGLKSLEGLLEQFDLELFDLRLGHWIGELTKMQRGGNQGEGEGKGEASL